MFVNMLDKMFKVRNGLHIFRSLTKTCTRDKSFNSKLPLDAYKNTKSPSTITSEADKGFMKLTLAFAGFTAVVGIKCYKQYRIDSMVAHDDLYYEKRSKSLFSNFFGDAPQTSTEHDEKIDKLMRQVIADTNLENQVNFDELDISFVDHLSVHPRLVTWPKVGADVGTFGLPFYATYKSVNDVKLSELKHKLLCPQFLANTTDRKSLDLSQIPEELSEEIDELKETLVLSDKAKKFMLATYLKEYASTLIVALKIIKYYVLISLIYSVGHKFQDYTIKLNAALHKGKRAPTSLPLPVVVASYIVTGSIMFLQFYFLGNVGRRSLNLSLDEYVCQLGPDYVEGGVEFYSKALKRVAILRRLLPQDCAHLFSEDGDCINSFDICEPGLLPEAIQERLKKCQEAQKQLERGVKVNLGGNPVTNFLVSFDDKVNSIPFVQAIDQRMQKRGKADE